MSIDRFLEIIRKLSIEDRGSLVEELLDILLSSVNLEMVPDDVGWKINKAYREGGFSRDELIGELVYAVSIAEPAKFKKILDELGAENPR
ncbi:MAG: hypothetical protein QXF28_02060 [Nitrososphaerota archaeon]